MFETLKKNEELVILIILLLGAFMLLANRVDKLNKLGISSNNISYNISK